MEQSSILSAKFDYPKARQSISLLATAHDCETGLWIIAHDSNYFKNMYELYLYY